MINNQKTRRSFLAKSLITAASASIVVSKLNGKEEEGSMRVISAEGEVYELDKKYVDKMCAGKASNEKLKNWLDGNKTK